LGRRVEDIDPLAGRTLAPLAIDEEVGRDTRNVESEPILDRLMDVHQQNSFP
jgi:hypothetical protein